MFWNRQDHLRAQLEEGLRAAVEFATLGASEPEPPATHPDAPRGPQARVFLFAKVSVPCPHSPVPAGSCDAAGAEPGEHRAMSAARSAVGTRRRVRRARRGGAAAVAPQPCTWAGPHGG
jgi:hypothetical protein